MRQSRHAPFNSIIPDLTGEHRIQPDPIAAGLTRLATSLDRLTTVLETGENGLGEVATTRYTRPPGNADMVDEKTMAEILNIPRRTLAYHRDQGRLPGCWIKNGRRILWHIAATRDAWQRGIG